MSEFAIHTAFYLALKLTGIFSIAVVLRRRLGTWHLAIPVAWVGLHLILFSGMFIASTFSGLNGALIWGMIGIIAVTSALCAPFPPLPIVLSRSELALVTGGILLAGGLWFRCLYYFDTTWDALVYGLPRIAFYFQNGTVFYHQTTSALNIFCNEWNAELISLTARLALGRDQAVMLGGVEIFAWTAFALFALARQLTASRLVAAGTSILLISTPSILGLATVIKGDLLAVGSLSLATACLIETARSRSLWSACAAVGVAAMGAGGKIILLPVVPVVAIGVILLCPRKGRLFLVSMIGLVTSVAFARFWANLLVYSNPIKRVGNESSVWGLETLLNNLRGIAKMSFLQPFGAWIDDPRWVFTFGAGAAGWLVVLTCAITLGFKLMRKSNHLLPKGILPLWLLVALAATALPAILGIPWQPWSFRYHLPWLVLLATAALSLTPNPIRIYKPFYTFLILTFAGLHASHVFQPGEAFPRSIAEQAKTNDIGRKLALHPYFLTPQLAELANKPPQSIWVLQEIDALLIPFFGENTRHHVLLASDWNAFEKALAEHSTEYAVISGPPLIKAFDPKRFPEWVVLSSTDAFLLLRRNPR